MSISFELTAEVRPGGGKRAARRVRRSNGVPAVLYGGDTAPTSVTLNHDAVIKSAAQESFYSHILTLNLGGKSERVVLKGMQRHPSKPKITHLDFQRVTDNTRIRMWVPLHFVGGENCPGVKVGGGIVSHLANNVEVICLAKDLPEYIEVDLSNLNAGHSVHLSELKCPPGVRLAALVQGVDHDLPVAAIVVPRGAEEAEAAPAAAAAPEAGAAAAPAAGGSGS